MMAINLTKGSVVARELRIARNFIERFRGLIGSKPLADGDGFLIPHCQGIHTFGMSYDIDVIYLDRDGRILAVYEALKPNRFAKVYFQSRFVLELPMGAIERSRSNIGDTLHLISTQALSPSVLSLGALFS